MNLMRYGLRRKVRKLRRQKRRRRAARDNYTKYLNNLEKKDETGKQS